MVHNDPKDGPCGKTIRQAGVMLSETRSFAKASCGKLRFPATSPISSKVTCSMRITFHPRTAIRLSASLKWWGVLASICVLGTILVANAYPLSWIALWPATVSVVPIAVFLFHVSVLMFGLLGKLIVLGLRRIRSRRHFEDALHTYTTSLDHQLNGLSREVEELKRTAEGLEWKVKILPTRSESKRAVLAG